MSYLVLFCCCVVVFFSPFRILITSLGEERANLSAFRTFVRFALVWFCLFFLPLGVWEGLRFVIVALPGLSLTFFMTGPSNNDANQLAQSNQSPHCPQEETLPSWLSKMPQ